MKLYVINLSNQKVYLNLVAPTRDELRNIIRTSYFSLGNESYSVNDVSAEKNANSTGAGAVIGGAIGALGGPIGIIIGGALGGIIGNNSDEVESAKVKKFNNS